MANFFPAMGSPSLVSPQYSQRIRALNKESAAARSEGDRWHRLARVGAIGSIGTAPVAVGLAMLAPLAATGALAPIVVAALALSFTVSGAGIFGGIKTRINDNRAARLRQRADFYALGGKEKDADAMLERGGVSFIERLMSSRDAREAEAKAGLGAKPKSMRR